MIHNLHNLDLQRVDSMTMAHSYGRRGFPFLDEEMASLGREIRAGSTLYSGSNIGKWILIKAFECYLPEYIL